MLLSHIEHHTAPHSTTQHYTAPHSTDARSSVRLIINHIEKMFVTSDCMTILKESEIMHPAAKMIILAASMQVLHSTY
jgi:hypothetical protein